ncbi:MFS transporter [Actinomadura decatromicini]|uniref:MFS transporter n=1 Tax=Actinomadura decatromicini TaxID=2604572 RepID=A0A5D3FWD1_9ACTN|nr:MFS transporter [Actinomadura decatromicini]TYK52289.1 MFS transporter [Actinomadura decatromicini]
MSEALRGKQDVGGRRPRLVGRRLALVFAATFASLTGVFLLLSVVPMYASASGAGGVGAGLATGALMLSTVLAELALPRLLARFGYRPVFATGLVLLGLPPIALVFASDMATITVVSLVRGLGFGVSVVVTNALVAAIVPAERRGEALGLFGLTAGLPTVLALPLGVWLAGHVGYTPVFLAGSAVTLAALATLPGLPSLRPAATEQAFGIVAGLRTAALLRPAAAFAATAMAAGILVTFLPEAVPDGRVAAAALLVQPAATTFTRWWAGRVGDRHGAGRLLTPALVAAAAGVALLVLVPNPVAVLASMALFGAGFGVAQNVSLAVMYERVPPSGYGTVSAVWNIGYDGGMGAGGAAFGVIAAQTGYPPAFALTAAVIALAVPLTLSRRVPGRRK